MTPRSNQVEHKGSSKEDHKLPNLRALTTHDARLQFNARFSHSSGPRKYTYSRRILETSIKYFDGLDNAHLILFMLAITPPTPRSASSKSAISQSSSQTASHRPSPSLTSTTWSSARPQPETHSAPAT